MKVVIATNAYVTEALSGDTAGRIVASTERAALRIFGAADVARSRDSFATSLTTRGF